MTTDRATGNSDSGSELERLRRQIDATDDAIWQLIVQRGQIARCIGTYKRQHNLPIVQSQRFAAMLEQRLLWAQDNGIEAETVSSIMTALHDMSVSVQQRED